MALKDRILALGLILATGLLLVVNSAGPGQAQPRITNTPIRVVIPTTAPTQPPQNQPNRVEPSPSPTFTPTAPLPDARLVSVAPAGTALIRDFPENGAVIGVLVDDIEYQVLGQYFSWYKIRLESNPGAQAWVYFEDIRVSGNLNDIPFADPNIQPAALSEQDIATATALVLFQTPGFAETATAESRVIELDEEEDQAAGPTSEFPPTYTPPAEIVQLATPGAGGIPTPVSDVAFIGSTVQSITEGNIPPIIPIIGLMSVGVLGILISLIRR